jgi:type IV pilus assembly protein PilW
VFDTTNPALMCDTVNMDNGGTITSTSLSPVSIVDGGTAAGASDQIIVHYGDSQTGGVNTGSVAYNGDAQTAFTNFFVPYLDKTGPGNCPLTLSDCTSTQYFMTTSGGTCTLAPINATQTIAVNPAGGLAYIGSWNAITFAVNNDQLQRNNIPIAPDVIDLQAQYGISATERSNVITQWVDATGATWASPTTANRNRIKAIHIAIVARNEQRDTGNVTTACSSLTTADPTGLCAWAGSDTSPAPAINLADADWQQYRYRVFDTIIPLRNVIWSGNTLP